MTSWLQQCRESPFCSQVPRQFPPGEKASDGSVCYQKILAQVLQPERQTEKSWCSRGMDASRPRPAPHNPGWLESRTHVRSSPPLSAGRKRRCWATEAFGQKGIGLCPLSDLPEGSWGGGAGRPVVPQQESLLRKVSCKKALARVQCRRAASRKAARRQPPPQAVSPELDGAGGQKQPRLPGRSGHSRTAIRRCSSRKALPWRPLRPDRFLMKVLMAFSCL